MTEIKSLNSKKYLLLALAAASAFLLWLQLPRILDPYALEEDLRTMYWVNRYQEPDLYPTVQFEELGVIDVQIGPWTFVNETSAPGYSLLFQLASNFVSPTLFSKLLAIPLMLFSVFYVYRIGERLSDSGTALALSLAFIVLISASHSEISVLSGLHRAFAIPLTLALVYYLMIGRNGWALITLLIDGLFYLPSFPVLVLTYAFHHISFREEGKWRLTIQWRRFVELFVVVLVVIAAISPTLVAQVGKAQTAIDSTFTGEQHLIDNPQFQEGGRSPLFILFPFIGRGGLTSASKDGLQLMILSFFAIIILFLRRSKTTKPPLVMMKLLYASLLGYALAWLTILLTSTFLLYLPSRHSRIGLFLFLLIFVAINFQEALRAGVGWVLQKRQQLIWYLLPLAALAVGFAFFLPSSEGDDQIVFRGPVASALLIGLTITLLVLTALVRRRRQESTTVDSKTISLPSRLNWAILGSIVFIFSLFYVQFMINEFYSPTDESRLLFDFVKTLPEDALLAGSPCSLDSIPYYGKRAVLFSCERYLSKPQMILDDLRAHYAAEGEQIYAFCQDYGVTYLVVDEDTLQPEFVAEGDYFFEPYNTILAPELMKRTNFVLDQIPAAYKLFQIDNVFVIACDSSLGALSANS